jgi:hypothetical protein
MLKLDNLKSVVCGFVLVFASVVTEADPISSQSTSCSESVKKTCWKAGALYYKDIKYYTILGCQDETTILNSVYGSDCQPKSDGYKMYSVPQANWVSMKIMKAKWVGGLPPALGFCLRTSSTQHGISVDCSECRTFFDSHDSMVPCN